MGFGLYLNNKGVYRPALVYDDGLRKALVIFVRCGNCKRVEWSRTYHLSTNPIDGVTSKLLQDACEKERRSCGGRDSANRCCWWRGSDAKETDKTRNAKVSYEVGTEDCDENCKEKYAESIKRKRSNEQGQDDD
mmetsp:Transcript_21987/g.26436  ORF Transcript_21987/g.26436 Transcript_21987/m.26436 type:complete len:134 (-) Transcript_21987:111-512(-)